jgi:hypothetical protein
MIIIAVIFYLLWLRKAWHSFRTFPLTDAKKAYIYLVGQLKKSFSGDVEFDGVGSSVSTLL